MLELLRMLPVQLLWRLQTVLQVREELVDVAYVQMVSRTRTLVLQCPHLRQASVIFLCLPTQNWLP